MSIELSTLPNGLRIITDHVPEMHSTALGIWCDVGTRYEDLKLNGIAHLVEHMMFKGTKRRQAMEIAQEIETVGGQMNAYTSREHTAYFIHLLKEDMPLALDVLADIMQNSTFPEDELEKERQVIIQEIGMTNDTPDDLVYDLYQSAAYPDQALGAPILGTSDIVANMPHGSLSNYVQKFYTPQNIIISAAGYIKHDDFVKRVTDAFANADASNDNISKPSAHYHGGENRLEKDLEQSHIVLGFQGTARTSEDYETTLLLSTILGGGMSSRLFQEVREKRGLVYSVYAHHSGYRDDGLLQIYAGTGPERLQELIPVVCDELVKLGTDCITSEELNRAKAQVRASLLMGQESMLSRADRQAKYFFAFNNIPNISKTIERINSVSETDICTMAQKIFTSPPTLGGLGPLSQLENFDKIKSRLI